MPNPTILYAADGTEIRTDQRAKPVDWVILCALLSALVLIGFIAG
jgi:hypothetical protein